MKACRWSRLHMAGSIALGLLALTTSYTHAAEQTKTECFKENINGVPAARLRVLAKGINISRWLNPALDEAMERPDKKTLEKLREFGFTHIRLPVSGNRFQDAGFLRELDDALATLLGHGFAVTIDMHPRGDFWQIYKDDSERGSEILVKAWAKLSKRYAKLPADRVFFEVLNEPRMDRDSWKRLAGSLIKTIREHAKDHTLIFGAARIQRFNELKNSDLPDQSNIVYAVHFYDPAIFTLQGQNWGNKTFGKLSGIPFPTRPDDKRVQRGIEQLYSDGFEQQARDTESGLAKQPWTPKKIADVFKAFANWARLKDIPVIVNEFGVFNHKAPRRDRLVWLQSVREAAEDNCIGWALWELTMGFGVFDNKEQAFDKDMINVLLPSRSPR